MMNPQGDDDMGRMEWRGTPLLRDGGRHAVFALLRWSGLPLLARRILQRGRTTILLYHDIDARTLDLHLTALRPRYHLVSLRDYVVARTQRHTDPLPPRPLIITLDDGLRSQHALLEVFRKHAVTPTIFICSGIVGTHHRFWFMAQPNRREVERLKRIPDEERLASLASVGYRETGSYPDRSALSLAEINEMSEAVDFQAHTVFHPILTQCTDERAWKEISECRRSLQQDLGLDVCAFAYPNGSYSDREVGYVSKAGYTCAVTTDLGFNDSTTDLLTLKRICIPPGAGANEIIVRASGLASYLKRLVRGTQSLEVHRG
jgi:poly-beta-1,6-N-acetyl-D-glucosamine N-deacetylase